MATSNNGRNPKHDRSAGLSSQGRYQTGMHHTTASTTVISKTASFRPEHLIDNDLTG